MRHTISAILFIKKIIYNSNDAGVYAILLDHSHPNIAKLYEVDRDMNQIILIEEYINGVTLEYALSMHTFTYTEIIHIMQQLMDAIAYLHHFEAPIIHRDLKPGNIMLTDNQIKLIDFEIARLYKAHQGNDTRVVGSPGFAAPEQYGFHQSDQRSDIYALGIVLKCMCEHVQQKEVQKYFASVIGCCMQLDPLNRYQTIQDMQKAFLDVCNLQVTTAPVKKAVFLAIPGFANESKKQKAAIYLYYLFLLYMILTLDVKSSGTFELIIIKICTLLIFISFLWIPKNVGRILELFSWYQSPNKIVRIINGIWIWFLSTCILLLIAAFIVGIAQSLL